MDVGKWRPGGTFVRYRYIAKDIGPDSLSARIFRNIPLERVVHSITAGLNYLSYPPFLLSYLATSHFKVEG
jgi:hypothetical protein